MAFQGKCNKCKVVWQWKKEELIRYVRCPQCGKTLKRTSSLFKDYPRKDIAEAKSQEKKIGHAGRKGWV